MDCLPEAGNFDRFESDKSEAMIARNVFSLSVARLLAPLAALLAADAKATQQLLNSVP